LSLLRLLSPQSVGLLLDLGFLPSLSSYSSVKPLSLSLLLLESFNSSLLVDPELFLTFFLQHSLLSTPLEIDDFLGLARAEQDSTGTFLSRELFYELYPFFPTLLLVM
jgi:hypothetical protein